MQYSLDTSPPTFPEGVTIENIISLIADLRTNFDLAIKLLPQATQTYLLSTEDPLIEIEKIKNIIDSQILLDSMRYVIYPIVFASPTVSTLVQSELFSQYHQYILDQFNNNLDLLFTPKFDFDGNTESESQINENSIYTTFPGSFIASQLFLNRLMQPMSQQQARFALQALYKMDSSFFNIAEIQEVSVFLLSKLAISDCQMSDFNKACESTFEQIDTSMAVTNTANQMYQALDSELLEQYLNFDYFCEHLIPPRRTSLSQEKIFKIISNLITHCNLNINNTFKLICYMYESCKEETVTSFVKKVTFGCPIIDLDFNTPFPEEAILDEEIMDQLDRVVNSFSKEMIDKQIQLINSQKQLNFIQVFFSLRILTLFNRKVKLNIPEFIKINKQDTLSLYLLSYDRSFINIQFLNEQNAELYLTILARYLLENYTVDINPQLEQIVAFIQNLNNQKLENYTDQIIKTFLKQNEDVQFNIQTYRKLFKRNDNLILALSAAFNTKYKDEKLVELALETIPHSEEIDRDVLQQLTKSLFNYVFQFINSDVSDTPIQAIACLTAFYFSFDISPAFCGVINSMKYDFLNVYENLQLKTVNHSLLPGLLLIMTSIFELPLTKSIEILFNYIEQQDSLNFAKQVGIFSQDFNSYLFVHSVGIRLCLQAGAEDKEIDKETQKQISQIIQFYVCAGSQLAEVTIGIVQLVTEAFQNQFSSVYIIFNGLAALIRSIANFDYKDCKVYKKAPIGFEIYALAISGLLTFEHGPQWSSSKYINKSFITLLLDQTLQNTDFTNPNSILRLIFAIKYVRNSFMGEKAANNNYYKLFIAQVKQHISNPTKTNLQAEYDQLIQACISFYIFSLSSPNGSKYDIKINNPMTIQVLELCQKLIWEDQNSLEISFQILNQLYDQRKLTGKVQGLAEKSLYNMEKYLDEEDESSEEEVD